MTEDHSQPPRQALAYELAHVPQGSILLVDNNLWTDLVRRGFDLSEYTATTLKYLPLVAAPIRHSEVVASFGDGDVAVRRVIKDAPD